MMTPRQIDENNVLDAQRMRHIPCGCPACDHGVQQGHFACEQPSDGMLEREERGEVVRAYEDGAWRWIVVTR